MGSLTINEYRETLTPEDCNAEYYPDEDTTVFCQLKKGHKGKHHWFSMEVYEW